MGLRPPSHDRQRAMALAALRSSDHDGEVFDCSLLAEIGDPRTESMLVTMFVDQAAERLPATAV